MSGRTFQGWAVPQGVTVPKGPGPALQAGGVRVRYAEVDAIWVGRLAGMLREAREGLAARTARGVASTLGRVGARFLDPGDPLRGEALDLLPETSGLSAQMAAAVLDGMASDWTEQRLLALLDSEFTDCAVLDGFVEVGAKHLRAMGPELCVQVVSGSVPGVGATALFRSLLVKGPTLVKPGRGDVVLPVLAARAIQEEDPVLGDAIAVVYFPGGSESLEDAALLAGDVVVAYGGDEAVRSLRARSPVTARFVAYHHRVSFGIVGREAVAAEHHAHQVMSEVAGAVAFFDQRGCVSPQVVYVEEGGAVSPREFARGLADALRVVEDNLPGGVLDAAEASARHQARGTAELMAASGSGVEVHHGGDAGWAVIYDPAAAFAPSCVGRVVRVKPVADVLHTPGLVAHFASHLQSVGVAGVGDRIARLSEELAHVGVSRITGFDMMPFPPPDWHHDGQGPLRALVGWVDLEV
jgi:hypothetical protein